MSFDTRARREADLALSTVRGVNPMAQLTELKREATTRRRAAVVAAVTVAVVVVVTGWLAATQFGDSDDRTVVPAQTPSAAARTPSTGDLDPGRYSVPVLGSDIRAEVTVAGPGWTFDRWLGNPDKPGYLLFWTVGNVPSDPCDAGQGSVPLPSGHSPEDLVTALGTQARTTVSEPTAAVVGGYPALRVDLIGGNGVDSGCIVWSDPLGFTRGGGGASTSPLVIVDVDGTTVVIDPQADRTDREVARMIESVTFTTP